MATKKRIVDAVQSGNGVRSARGGREHLGLKRIFEPREQGSTLRLGSLTRRTLALSLAGALGLDGASLRHELGVQITLGLEVFQMNPHGPLEADGSPREGTLQLRLESGTDLSSAQKSFIEAQIYELSPSLGACTLQDGRGQVQGAGDFG